MFSCVLLLVLANSCGANRYEAAEAIQHAIFGEDTLNSTIVINSDHNTEETMAEETNERQTSAAAAPADNVARAENKTAARSITVTAATDSAAISASSPGPASPSQPKATPTPATTRQHHHHHTTGHSYTGTGRGGHQQRPSSRPATTTPPSQGGKRKSSGHSYSFVQLSSMSANSAPGQKGNFYVPREHERIPRILPCQVVKCHLSIAVVMDSSGSVGFDDYQKELSFVRTLLEILSIKAEDSKLKVCAGLVSYSSDVHVEVDPCCQNSICRIVDQFQAGRLAYRAGSTNTHGALKVARQMLQAAASYKKVALLITDGKSNTGGSPVPFAKRMREQDGIQLVALGVTNDVNKAELMGVSGMDRVTKIDVFDEFHELASLLLQANKVASKYELKTSFDAMCHRDKSIYKENQCVRVMTEEQKSQCVMAEWSKCVRRGNKCSQTRTCKLSGIIILREDQTCECPPCEAGEYLDVTDRYCKQCGANTYSVSGATSCVSCPGGLYSDPGSGSLTDCVKEFDIVDAHGKTVTADKEEYGGLLLYKGGTVCDDYFDVTAANAICKAMGRPFGGAEWKNAAFYNIQSSKSIKLDDVKCHSAEWTSCSYRTTHNCSHTEDVHLICKGKKEPSPTKGTTQKTDRRGTTAPDHHAVTA